MKNWRRCVISPLLGFVIFLSGSQVFSQVLDISPHPSQQESKAEQVAQGIKLPEMTPSLDLSDLTGNEQDVTVLTLENSIDLAVRGATSILNAQNDVKVNGAQLLQSYGQFFPNLTAQSAYGYSTGTNYYAFGAPALVKGSGTTAGYTVMSTLNLFNGLSDVSSLKSAILKKDASELTLQRAKQQIALDISQGFLQVILDKKIVDIATKNQQQSKAREKLLEAQTKVGAKSLSDLFRQQAQTSSDEAFLYSVRNKTRSDQINFIYKLRLDVSKKYRFMEPELKEAGANIKFSVERDLLTEALANRMDLKASEQLAEAAHFDVTASKASYLPRMDLVGSAISGGRYLFSQDVNGTNVLPPSQNNLGYQLGNQVNYTLTVALTWSLFDRFVTHQNVSRSEVIADNLELYSQDRKNQVIGDVRRSYGDYQLSIQQLQSSKKGLEAAQKAYAVMEGRYRVGAANFIDLVTSQSALVQAESTRAQTLIDFKLQAKTVEFAIGEIQVD